MAAVRRLRGRETHHPEELSYAQYGLLFSLADGRCMSARELADAAALSPATATPMLEALEAARAGPPDPLGSTDKRVVLTALTHRRRGADRRAAGALEPMWRAALAGFSDEELTTAARNQYRFFNGFV